MAQLKERLAEAASNAGPLGGEYDEPTGTYSWLNIPYNRRSLVVDSESTRDHAFITLALNETDRSEGKDIKRRVLARLTRHRRRITGGFSGKVMLAVQLEDPFDKSAYTEGGVVFTGVAHERPLRTEAELRETLTTMGDLILNESITVGKVWEQLGPPLK